MRLGGVLQPIGDAVKLLFKTIFLPSSSNSVLFFVSPVASLTFSISLFILFFSSKFWRVPLSVLFFLSLIAISVFPPAFAGWASGSFYRKLGGSRNLVQTVRYEITLFIILLFPLWVFNYLTIHSKATVASFMLIVVISFFIVLLAETNRAPFDLAEGERELVSGFNTEFGGRGFVLFFLAEYAQIISMCLVGSSLFFCGYPVFFSFLIGLVLVLLTRSAWPRLRYDALIIIIWTALLPTLNALIILFSFL